MPLVEVVNDLFQKSCDRSTGAVMQGKILECSFSIGHGYCHDIDTQHIVERVHELGRNIRIISFVVDLTVIYRCTKPYKPSQAVIDSQEAGRTPDVSRENRVPPCHRSTSTVGLMTWRGVVVRRRDAWRGVTFQ